MPVAPNTLAVGKCYLKNNQVRKITKITDDDMVWYDARSAAQPNGWGPGAKAKRQTFADAVDHEVPCNYDSNYDGKKP